MWTFGHSRAAPARIPYVGPFCRWVRQEIGPFAPALVIARYLLVVYADAGRGAGGLIDTNAVLGLVAGAVFWWAARNDPDDDDRWKRRRRRLAQVVRSERGRLVVAPATSR